MWLISAFINHVYRSLFLTGDRGFRNTYPWLKLLFITVTIYSYILFNPVLTLYLLALFLLTGFLDKGWKWFVSVSILSLIPSTWYLLTAYLFSATGLSEYVSIDKLIWIFIRTYTFTYMIIFYASIINPSNIYNMLLKTGLKKYSVTPVMIWRITPYTLKNMAESIMIGGLKGERVRDRIAPAIASMIEAGELFKESSYYKIYGEPRHKIPVENSKKHNIYLAVMILTTILATVVMK